MIALRSRGAIALLTVLLLVAAVMMPVQIRPAAYNQREPLAAAPRHQRGGNGGGGGAGHFDRSSVLDDDDDAPGATDDPAAEASPFGPNATSSREDYLLNLYVVFHRRLDTTLFDNLRLPDAVPEAAGGGGAAGGGAAVPAVERSGGGGSRLARGSLMDVVLGGNKDVTFFATNPDVDKEVNASDPLVRFRMVNEWETTGFQHVTGAQYGSSLNEFGAMASIFYSVYTYKNTAPQLEMTTFDFADSSGRRRRIVLRNGMDDAFIGILQYDMRLTDRVIGLIRRKIRTTRRPAQYVAPEPPPDPMMRGRTGRIASSGHARALRLSPMHRGAVADAAAAAVRGGAAAAAAAAPGSKCCVFYAVQMPMSYVLRRNDPATRKLITLYNMHFFKQYTYDDLARIAVIDAFVMPFSEFNKLVPFLENIMRNGVRAGAMVNATARAAALRELEQALALFIGFLGREGFEYVATPLRHEPAR
jgi:hypothetical protein